MKKKILKYQEILNKEIDKINFYKKPENLYKPIKYILSLKSKRVRPTLSILSYKLFKNDLDNILIPSISLELFHNFTLIHDDIMDNADLRRGKKTVHKKWNKNIGILSGDILMIYAYSLLEGLEAKIYGKILKRFNEISIMVCEGQQFDMDYEEKALISEEEYLEMIKLKTAVLIGFSLELGGMVADVDKNTTNKLYSIGEMLGIGFQLMDDYLDVFGSPGFGKKIGGDIIANKKTYLMINLLKKSDEKDIKIIEGLKNSNNDKEKIKLISELMIKYGINILAKKTIGDYFKTALNELEEIKSESDYKVILSEYFNEMMVRIN
ncbi:MAG: isoprenyl synthetase [Flammeovirgaceae bacterium]|jgi:geranylgeranyl diphosphate synthase type II|nr:isoprenyl synthetase [Flammeovirgaceae bacterium]|tara:strand:- start:608 stop:1576 length:969 start_codon:yes stop_codon:yes gene_type:complete